MQSRTFTALLLLILSPFIVSTTAADEPAARLVYPRIELVPRRPLDVAILGINAFVNDSRFGPIKSQFLQVRDTLHLPHVRVLFNWDDAVQSSPSAQPNFAFYDAIVRNLPRGMDALPVLAGLPSWMQHRRNWQDGNPRLTFVQRWVKPVLQRYGRRGRLAGFQIWNEPNMDSNPENTTLGVVNDPANYLEMMEFAEQAMREYAPGKKFVPGATTAINQNYPETLEYNEALRQAGLEELADVWPVHYYGKQYEKVIFGGIGSFLNEVKKPIWITEIGEQGVNQQLAYFQRTLPFLKQQIPGIERAYIYQFTEATPAGSTYGLRNLTRGQTVSDLFIHLRDRGKAVRKR